MTELSLPALIVLMHVVIGCLILLAVFSDGKVGLMQALRCCIRLDVEHHALRWR